MKPKKQHKRVFLKITDKELLKEVSKLCNSEYTVKLIKEFETEKM